MIVDGLAQYTLCLISLISTQGIEELQRKGLVKAIGVSNFSITKTERLLQTAKIAPALNSVECHPYFQQPKLKEYCDSKGINEYNTLTVELLNA